ncbi:MAG TPA: hypothetical protein DF383_08715 [Deltaproteobacteria bacterium]|nr:hypothetical protein [Deltaproteobacteria bacterium]
MFETLSEFIVSAIVIVFAAHRLVQASEEIAACTGIGHLFIGSLFLAGSTSAPEFFVDVRATMEGIPNLAAGDLLGSSLMNLMIFSFLALRFHAMREPARTPDLRLSSLLAALLSAEVGFFIWLHPPWQLLGLNVGSLLLMGTYLFGMRRLFRRMQSGTPSPAPRVSRRQVFKPMLKFFLATLAIFFASPLLVGSMESIALKTGLGNTFIGTSLLALTTSFPELVASITAARRGLFDLMLGNIVGSNALNMVIFVLMDWIWQKPPLWSHLENKNIFVSGAVVFNMLIVALTWGGRKKHPALKLTGTLLILLFSLGCYVFLYLFRGSF